jgi:lipopolysaccharide transport system permease protein
VGKISSIKFDKHHYQIKPPNGLIRLNIKEIWDYKDLLYILIMRNIKVRYKQTIIGFAAAIVPPFTSMIVFTIFFGKIAGIPSDKIPYAIFVYSGLLYWNYFSSALSSASSSFVADAGIIQKVYFPRLILPLSTSITPMIDFSIAFVILFLVMIYYHFTPHFTGILLIPFLLLIAFLTATGIGLFAASINVKYRDVNYAIAFIVSIMLYVTPVIYPISIIPVKFQWLMYANPIAGVVTTARYSLLGTGTIDWKILFISLGISLMLFLIGIIYFRKTERFFADVI